MAMRGSPAVGDLSTAARMISSPARAGFGAALGLLTALCAGHCPFRITMPNWSAQWSIRSWLQSRRGAHECQRRSPAGSQLALRIVEIHTVARSATHPRTCGGLLHFEATFRSVPQRFRGCTMPALGFFTGQAGVLQRTGRHSVRTVQSSECSVIHRLWARFLFCIHNGIVWWCPLSGTLFALRLRVDKCKLVPMGARFEPQLVWRTRRQA